jgi:hypothetical protein
MSSRDLTIFPRTFGGHLATLMTRYAFNRAFDGALNMTEAIRCHVFDRHIGDVEWNLKGLAHRWTRLSAGCSSVRLTQPVDNTVFLHSGKYQRAARL